MNNRDRLIELLEQAKIKAQDTIGSMNNGFGAWYADYLLEHGVIVPPCKVGDTVYYITGIGHNLIKPAKIKEIIIDKNGIKDLYVKGDGYNFEMSFDIFFLTREEAEKALEDNRKEYAGK